MKTNCDKTKHALILVEGDTEVLFYKRIKKTYFPHARSHVFNLEGNFNINNKIVDQVINCISQHPNKLFMVSVCIDRESRCDKAQIDMKSLQLDLSDYSDNIEDLKLFEAIQDIESWFFHDIDGIYSFLRFQKARRNLSKYKPVEKFNNRDLSKLFTQAGKEYKKGEASENFINNLNLEIIKTRAKQLSDLIDLMSSY